MRSLWPALGRSATENKKQTVIYKYKKKLGIRSWRSTLTSFALTRPDGSAIEALPDVFLATGLMQSDREAVTLLQSVNTNSATDRNCTPNASLWGASGTWGGVMLLYWHPPKKIEIYQFGPRFENRTSRISEAILTGTFTDVHMWCAKGQKWKAPSWFLLSLTNFIRRRC